MKQNLLIIHNVRSALNVGSLLRTADGMGLKQVYMTGYTPYPIAKNDQRIPHEARAVERKLAKSALGAEKSVASAHREDILELIAELQRSGYTVIALEQTAKSLRLPKYTPPKKWAVIVGNEVDGLEESVLSMADLVLEIPMLGQKESLNVAVAGAIGLYQLTQK